MERRVCSLLVGIVLACMHGGCSEQPGAPAIEEEAVASDRGAAGGAADDGAEMPLGQAGSSSEARPPDTREPSRAGGWEPAMVAAGERDAAAAVQDAGAVADEPGSDAGDCPPDAVCAEACADGDTWAASEGECLLLGPACYPLFGGGYCNHPLEDPCPAGSRSLPAGEVCQPGSDCFEFSPGTNCARD